jgi:perosamine synthetase
VSDRIAMSAPDLDATDEAAVVDALRSGVLGLGPYAERFEHAAAEVAGVEHGVAVSSGTAALHLIVKSLNIGPGDEVLVPSFTFAASVNAFLFEGATPIFVDIESDTYNIDPAEVERRMSDRTKAVMVVDVFGHPADWYALEEVAGRHDLLLIDDSCEAIGASYRGRPVGSFGQAGAFAFYPNKQMTTGEGGMVVTDDGDLAESCRSLRNQGRSVMGTWLEHERLGFNYRLDELSAALGVSQIARLGRFLASRSKVARWYSERLSTVEGVEPPTVRPDVEMSWFVYVVTLDAGIDREAVAASLAVRGIPTRAYFLPLHRQAYITERFPDTDTDLPVTDRVARSTLALPFHNRLSEEHIDDVVEALRLAVEQAGVTASHS